MLNIFPCETEIKARISALTDDIRQCNKPRKRNKEHTNLKRKKIRLFLFEDNMVVNIEEFKDL